MRTPEMNATLLQHGQCGQNQVFFRDFIIYDCSRAGATDIIELGVQSLEEAEEIASKHKDKKRIVIVENISQAKIVRLVDTRK